MKKYKTIVADPPWPENGGGKIKRGASRHYKLMTVAQIKKLPVADLASDEGCHLYLWVTNNHLASGIEVMEAWGFRYVTVITWAKDRMGLGQYFRGKTEQCLFGVKGNLPYKKKLDGKRAQGTTLIQAPRRKHSEKPEQLNDTAELVSHGPRVELFARRIRDGWDVWGDQVSSDIEFAQTKSK